MNVYSVLVREEGSRKYFTSEVEADTIELALESATRQLLEAYLAVPPKTPGQPEHLIVSIMLRDFESTPQAWRISLKDKTATPCPECLGEGGVDSGGVTPWGSGIEIPCPSCPPTKRTIREIIQSCINRLEKLAPNAATNDDTYRTVQYMKDTLKALDAEPPQVAFHQTLCAVCSESRPLDVLIGTCTSCRAKAAERVTTPTTGPVAYDSVGLMGDSVAPQWLKDRMKKLADMPPPTPEEVETQFAASAKFRSIHDLLLTCSGQLKILYRDQSESVITTVNETLDRINCAVSDIEQIGEPVGQVMFGGEDLELLHEALKLLASESASNGAKYDHIEKMLELVRPKVKTEHTVYEANDGKD